MNYMEIILAPSRIRTHQGRVMQLMKQALYLQAATAGSQVYLNKTGMVKTSFRECAM